MKLQLAQYDLNDRFTYQGERRETWRILTGPGKVRGDCEDYALTLVWLAEGRSLWRFWWALLICRYVIWYCKSPGGGGHAVLWCRGAGWTDNIMRDFVIDRKKLKSKGYGLRFPMILPLVVLKMLQGRFRKKQK